MTVARLKKFILWFRVFDTHDTSYDSMLQHGSLTHCETVYATKFCCFSLALGTASSLAKGLQSALLLYKRSRRANRKPLAKEEGNQGNKSKMCFFSFIKFFLYFSLICFTFCNEGHITEDLIILQFVKPL